MKNQNLIISHGTPDNSHGTLVCRGTQFEEHCCRGYKPLQPRENTATTHTAIIHTVASHTVNTHTVATHTVTTHTLATHTVATHIAGTHTVAKHITTTHTACTYATTTHTFNAGNKMETKQ